MPHFTFFTFLALLALALGSPFSKLDITKLDITSHRILGGLTAKHGQFPYQVSLHYPGYGHFCGGSILNKNWILTAAHCTHNRDPNFSVFVGVTNLKDMQNGSRHEISEIIPHAEFNSNGKLSNDISLIKLKDSIKFSKNINSVKLPSFDMDVEGLQVVESGWGSLFLGGSTPNQLQYLYSEVHQHEACVKRIAEIPNFPPVLEKHICTFTRKGEGLCHGDSGGPIVADGIQVGIVSLGYPCAKGYPDVNTNVWSFIDWITSHINEH